jgi:PIN like domain
LPMRVLLDECVPRALRSDIPGHEVKTVAEMGWAGVKNGELMRLAAGQFDVLLTVDRNLEYQQNFAALSLAVIVVHAPSNDIAALRPLMPAVLAAIPNARLGAVAHVPQLHDM